MDDDAPPVLAELSGGLLDDRVLARLFSDLAAEAEILAILCKGAARAHGGHAAITLDDARARLEDGSVRAIQIRYRWRGAEWWDTLMRTPEGLRLVRMQQDFT